MRQFIYTIIRKIFKLVFSVYKPKVRILYKGRKNIDLTENGDQRIRVGKPFYLAGNIYKLDQLDNTSVFKLALYKKESEDWSKANDLDLILRLNAGYNIFYV
jgi:hypothetical protein|nr:MAG TPA: hypothetical protein [Caudoviricetes sp.]